MRVGRKDPTYVLADTQGFIPDPSTNNSKHDSKWCYNIQSLVSRLPNVVQLFSADEWKCKCSWVAPRSLRGKQPTKVEDASSSQPV